MNNPISKIERSLSLSEKTEQQILEAIHQKIFLPGDKLLGEIEFAENFGVSRTVVREALNRLCGRGILESRKGRGFYLATDPFLSVTGSMFNLLEMKCGNSSLLNIVDVRIILEPEIAWLSAENRTEDDLIKMKSLYSKMKQNITDSKQMIRYDIDFHRLIVKTSNNPIFPVIMEPVFQLMFKFISKTYQYPHSPDLALRAHENIIKAIERRDKEAAFISTKNHMLEAREHAVKVGTN